MKNYERMAMSAPGPKRKKASHTVKPKTKAEREDMSTSESDRYVSGILRDVGAEKRGLNRASILVGLYKALPRDKKTPAMKKRILPFDFGKYKK